jgi:glutathione peroxidase
MSDTVYDIPLQRIDGQSTSLAAFRGKVLLVVNVASKCGLTPQYEGLQALYSAQRNKGLEVLGFPANNFMSQEPGTEAEIVNFCSTNYQVDFPMFSKISVTGADKHPLYSALTQAQPKAVGDGAMREKLAGYGIKGGEPAEILWNFEKFLVSRDGKVVERFAPDITASDPRLVAAIDRELAKH